MIKHHAANKQPRPTDTDWRKERTRDTVYTVAAVLAFLLVIFLIVGGFNDIPVKGVHP